MKKTIRQILLKIKKVNFSDKDILTKKGYDSLDMLKLITSIEASFKIKVTHKQMSKMSKKLNVENIVKILKK